MALSNGILAATQVIGSKFKDFVYRYSDRDVILYSLGIGMTLASPTNDPLRFIYEGHNNFAVQPTFATVPAMGVVCDSILSGNFNGFRVDPKRIVLGEQYLEVFRPLPPSGVMTSRGTIADVVDKGVSGIVVAVNIETLDAKTEDRYAFTQTLLFVRGRREEGQGQGRGPWRVQGQGQGQVQGQGQDEGRGQEQGQGQEQEKDQEQGQAQSKGRGQRQGQEHGQGQGEGHGEGRDQEQSQGQGLPRLYGKIVRLADVPDRAPDVAVEESIGADQAATFRMSSTYDRNPLHIDDGYARAAGYPPGHNLHGVCLLGIVARQALAGFFRNEVDRFKGVKVRVTAPVFPSDVTRSEMWREQTKTGSTRIHVRMRNLTRGTVCVDKSYVDFSQDDT